MKQEYYKRTDRKEKNAKKRYKTSKIIREYSIYSRRNARTWDRVDLLRSWSTPERCASASFFLNRKTCGLMLATGGEIELGFIICSGAEQVGDFLIRGRPDSRILAPLCFSAVWTAVRQRRIFKAVMAGIAEIVIQVCSPHSVRDIKSQVSRLYRIFASLLRDVCSSEASEDW